jgi:hypothetical protein
MSKLTQEYITAVIKWINSEYDGNIEHDDSNKSIYFRYKDGRLIPFVYDIPSNTMLFRDEEVIRKLSQYFGIDITEIKEILKTWTSQKLDIKRNVDFRFSMLMKINF